jgi:hypothetical protein
MVSPQATVRQPQALVPLLLGGRTACTEPFSSSDFAGLKNVDGFGSELASMIQRAGEESGT